MRKGGGVCRDLRQLGGEDGGKSSIRATETDKKVNSNSPLAQCASSAKAALLTAAVPPEC